VSYNQDFLANYEAPLKLRTGTDLGCCGVGWRVCGSVARGVSVRFCAALFIWDGRGSQFRNMNRIPVSLAAQESPKSPVWP